MLPAPTSITEFYDRWSGSYSEEITVKTKYSIPEWIQENSNLLPDGQREVLDLGCADGFIGKKLSLLRPDFRFTGVDLSPQMVEACSKVYVSCVCFDLNNGLPPELQVKRYDVVVATSALEFIQDHDMRFKEIASLLKTNGQFWLTVEKREPTSLTEVFGQKKVLYSTEAEIHALLDTSGFRLIKTEAKTAFISPATQQPITYFCIIAQKQGE